MLDVLQWPLVGGFIWVFGLVAFLLARKHVVVVAGTAPVEEKVPDAKPKKSKPSAPSAPRSAVAPTNWAASLAEVDAAIGSSLEGLKKRLFRLELRLQACTISDE